MNPEIITINEDQIFDYLNKKDRPVMEFDIIKYFIPSDSDTQVQPTLFVKHFSIYHALYKLKFYAGLKGFYLHLDCMRIRLIHIPDKCQCRHYDPENGNFCGTYTSGDYCIEHEAEYINYSGNTTFDILQDFYSDQENISFGDSGILKKLLSGIKTYCVKKKDIDEALKFFDIHRPGKKRIAIRYRELALQYHPDKCNGSDEMMKKLNGFYTILKEVYIL